MRSSYARRVVSTTPGAARLAALALLALAGVLAGVLAAPAEARPACQGNLVQDWGFQSAAAWTTVDGSPDFATGTGALDAGYVGMWGNRTVGEALGQALGGGGLVAGRTYMIDVWLRHVADPNKVGYSQARLVAFAAADRPTDYDDLFGSGAVEIGVRPLPKVSSTTWQRVTFGPWPAPADLPFVALHVVNENAVDDGGLTSYANLDNLCIRERVPPTLCGSKFQDADCDGERGAGDEPLAGWEIQLTAPDGTVRTTTTAADGSYCFDDLDAGTHRVSEAAQPGWVQTAPLPGGAQWLEVGVEGDVEGPDFGNQLCARCPDEEPCPDADDPRVSYVSQDPSQCAVIRFTCPEGHELFSGGCGCGCEAPCGATAVAAGLHYPGDTCSSAVPKAEAAVGSSHYRNACAEATGGELPERVSVSAVTACRPSGDGVMLDVELCCPEPPGEPELEVAKELVGPTDDASIHLIFAVTVTNTGNATMPGPVEVRDTLPQGYLFAGGAGCASSDRTLVTCTHAGDLAPGEEARFEIVAELDRSAFTDRTNCAALLTAGGADPANDSTCLPLSCPDRNDPSVHYFGERGDRDHHARCPRLEVRCGDDQTFFWGACGCGCIDEPDCREPLPFEGGGSLLSADEPAGDVTGLLDLPDRLQPGDRVVVTPRDPERTPPEGTWSINGRVVERRDPGPSVLCVQEPWWVFDVPFDWRVGEAVRVVYESPAGEVLVDAVTDAVVGEPVEAVEGPSIEGGTPFTVPGGEACACGSFPTPESRAGLLFDGEALGAPASAGRGVVHFRVPQGVELGEHRVSGWPAAGFSAGDGVDLAVGEVRASLDQSTLARGGSTRLYLQVVGTEAPVTLRLRNYSPRVVAVEGGDDQELVTSGGAENVVAVQVRGVGDGDFDLRWELPGCPCGEGR